MNKKGYLQSISYISLLVVVLVAERRASCVKDIPNLDVWPDTVHIDACVERQRIAVDICAINGSRADTGILILPDAEVAVDETL